MEGLSLCILARNEETSIGRAIASFAGIAEEVVVLDTGSTDSTWEVARSLGARVHDFAWEDDFAAAFNALHAKARGDWVFRLDADEALHEDSIAPLAKLLGRSDLQGAYVLRQDLYDADQPNAYTEMAQLRLYRRADLPTMSGRCHPTFVPSLEEVAHRKGRRVAASEIRLRHWGYLRARRRGKLERGARLMRLELRDRPRQLYYLAELAATLFELGDPEAHGVLEEAASVLAHEPVEGRATTGAMVLLELLLSLPDSSWPPGWNETSVAALGLKEFPRSVPLRWQLARRAFERDDLRTAREQLETIAELSRTGSYDRTVSFDPGILGDELWLNLGVCRMQMGDRAGARDCFQRVSPEKEFGEAAAENLALLRALRS